MPKLGDTIGIDIEKQRASKPVAPADATPPLRHGPVRRLPEDQPGPGQTNMMLIDTSQVWQDFAANKDPHSSGDGEAPGVMAYVPRSDLYAPTWDDFHIALVSSHLQIACFNRDSVKLPPFSGTEYRKIERGWPLPHNGINALGLSVKIGRQIDVKEGNAWKLPPSVQSRLNAATDPTVIANLNHEAHESAFATSTDICAAAVDPQMWFTSAQADQRALLRDYGLLQAQVEQRGYPLAVSSPIHFEPWDVTDTDNFKVTPKLNPAGTDFASFTDSTEVTKPPQMSVRQRSLLTKVWLVPQFWHFVISYTQRIADRWTDTTGAEINEVYSRDVTDEGYMPALTSPLILTGWETPTGAGAAFFPSAPSYLHAKSDTAYDPTDTSDASLLRLMMELSLADVAAQSANPHPTPTTPGTSQPPDGPNGPYAYAESTIYAQVNATVVVTQEGAPAKLLVGAIQLKDDPASQWFVWRKTARTVDAPVSIYSGEYNDPGYNNDRTGGTTCQRRIQSGDVSGVYPSIVYGAPRFTWQAGTLCGSDWPVLMNPRWLT